MGRHCPGPCGRMLGGEDFSKRAHSRPMFPHFCRRCLRDGLADIEEAKAIAGQSERPTPAGNNGSKPEQSGETVARGSVKTITDKGSVVLKSNGEH